MVKSSKRKINSVDTQLAVDILSEEIKTGQLRANAQNLDDDRLFVEDTQPDDAQIHLPAHRKKRARASKLKRMTRAEAIITANKPLPLAPGSTRPKRSKCQLSTRKATLKFTPREPSTEDWVVRQDVWSAVDTTSDWVQEDVAATRPACTDVKHRPQIPAVEVDPAGCSYNPDRELHQDVVAQAVAAEYAKQIDKELQPKAPPLAVTEEEFALKEMELGLFDDDSDADIADDGRNALVDAGVAAIRLRQKKTVKERVRQLRHKQMEKEHVLKRKLKQSRRDLDNLQNLNEFMDQQEEVQAARRARRQADVQEREAQEPPKLGRLRFTPQPTQVLATDDVNGSLRTLKTVPVIAKDRFKSLQKRGLIHVTIKQHWLKPSKRRVKRFEKKATQERHERSQQEIKQLKKQRQHAERRSR